VTEIIKRFGIRYGIRLLNELLLKFTSTAMLSGYYEGYNKFYEIPSIIDKYELD